MAYARFVSRVNITTRFSDVTNCIDICRQCNCCWGSCNNALFFLLAGWRLSLDDKAGSCCLSKPVILLVDGQPVKLIQLACTNMPLIRDYLTRIGVKKIVDALTSVTVACEGQGGWIIPKTSTFNAKNIAPGTFLHEDDYIFGAAPQFQITLEYVTSDGVRREAVVGEKGAYVRDLFKLSDTTLTNV